MFFIVYAFKGQVHVFTGREKILSHSFCRTRGILKYFCPLRVTIKAPAKIDQKNAISLTLSAAYFSKHYLTYVSIRANSVDPDQIALFSVKKSYLNISADDKSRQL